MTEWVLAASCTPRGRIERLESRGPQPLVGVGGWLQQMVGEGSVLALQRMLLEVHLEGSVVDWEMEVELADGVRPAYLSACTLDGALVVLGAARAGAQVEALGVLTAQEAAAVAARLAASQPGVPRRVDHPQLLDDLAFVNNELTRISRELAKKNSELQHLGRAKRRLVDMAAHDLRNPLAAMRSYLTVVLRSAELAPEHREVLQRVERLARTTVELIEDLLEGVSDDGGVPPLHRERTDLAESLRTFVAQRAPLAAHKGIELTAEVGELPEVEVDRGRLEQVVANLVDNALKFSSPGTRVRVRGERAGPLVRVSVLDEGPGIPAAELPRLFEPYARASTRPTGGERSTGLGLSIVKEIVERHGGEVGVRSVEGRGSEFSFTLPAG